MSARMSVCVCFGDGSQSVCVCGWDMASLYVCGMGGWMSMKR